MKTIFVSDLHLTGLTDPRVKSFLSFLDRELPFLERLVIGGDLFDFWVGIKNVVFDQYLPVLNKLYELKEKGVEIIYLEGNHDFSLGNFFTNTLNVKVVTDEICLKLGQTKVYVAHGDQVNSRDHGYVFLRWFLRTSVIGFILKILPPSWIWALSQKSSYASRHLRSTDPRTVELFRDFARKKCEDTQGDEMDVVVLGHSHHPDEQVWEIRGQKKYYFNTGDWLKHYTYLEYSDGKFELKKL